MGGGWWCLCVIAGVVFSGVVAFPSAARSETDSVNVISVENMDALLNLRLGPEAASHFNSSSITAKRRHRRIPLCHDKQCVCHLDNSRVFQNISCTYHSTMVVDLKEDNVSPNVREIKLEDIVNLTIHSTAFKKLKYLGRIVINNVDNLVVQNSAFIELNQSKLYFEINNCKKVIFEDSSFKNGTSVIEVKISNVGKLLLGKTVFSRLLKFTATNVPSLEVVASSFVGKSNASSLTLNFSNVNMTEIPSGAFTSALTITFTNCHLQRVSKNAFNGVEINGLYFTNTYIGLLESGAIWEGTLIQELKFIDVHLNIVQENVVRAVSYLTIYECTFNELHSGAFYATASSIQLLHNVFLNVHSGAFELNQWTKVIIKENLFKQFSNQIFNFPFQTVSSIDTYIFNFTDNEIHSPQEGALEFIPTDGQVTWSATGNRFGIFCSCNLQSAVRSWSKTEDLTEKVYESSSCLVDSTLIGCLQTNKGFKKMVDFTTEICENKTINITCFPATFSSVYPTGGLDWSTHLDNEKHILSFILATVVCSVSFILIVVAVMWIKRKGFFSRFISLFSHSSSSRLVASSSISRIDPEYTEIQNLHNRIHIAEENEEEEIFVPVDDKATQTLPEELTQDLLKTLREKLDDPENCIEAQVMIEHLYDLIKVEESCNNTESTVTVDDNVYSELPPQRRRRTRNRSVSSVGTRCPSLDKLDAVKYLPRLVLANHYSEPKDSHVSAHLYTELPGNVPDVLVTSTINVLANRPLPETPPTSPLL